MNRPKWRDVNLDFIIRQKGNIHGVSPVIGVDGNGGFEACLFLRLPPLRTAIEDISWTSDAAVIDIAGPGHPKTRDRVMHMKVKKFDDLLVFEQGGSPRLEQGFLVQVGKKGARVNFHNFRLFMHKP